AAHMEGMEGATAKTASAEDTTLSMVSYEDTDTGEEVQNHKWVTQDELSEVTYNIIEISPLFLSKGLFQYGKGLNPNRTSPYIRFLLQHRSLDLPLLHACRQL